MNVTLLLRTTQTAQLLYRSLNCWTAAITKKHRKIYKLTYPTYLILPDGSSINIHYDVPRKIITLPLNVDTLPQMERERRIAGRISVTKVKIAEETDDDFDETKFYKVRNQ